MTALDDFLIKDPGKFNLPLGWEGQSDNNYNQQEEFEINADGIISHIKRKTSSLSNPIVRSINSENKMSATIAIYGTHFNGASDYAFYFINNKIVAIKTYGDFIFKDDKYPEDILSSLQDIYEI